MHNQLDILLIHNIGRKDRDFHGPPYGRAFEYLGHTVTRIDYDQPLPPRPSTDHDFDFAFHFYHSIGRDKIDELKGRGITTILLVGDEPCEFQRTRLFTPWYDIVFNQTGGADNIKAHRELGANMYPLPHCADPTVYFPVPLDPGDEERYGADVSFIGTLTRRGDREWIEKLMRDRGFSFRMWGPGTEDNHWVSPTEVRRIYASSKVIFNPSAVADQPNWEVKYPTLLGGPACRMFNTAMAGAFQVAPRRPGWYFQPFSEEEICYYNHTNTDDLLGKIDLALSEPEWREEVAQAGRRRALMEHTYYHRAIAVIEYYRLYRGGHSIVGMD